MAHAREAMVRFLVYLTNHFVAHIPSHTMRRRWYRRMGIRIGSGSAIHLNTYVWFYGPRHLAGMGGTIGRNSIVNRRCTLDFRGPLTIGDNVSISPEVAVITTQHDWREPGFPLDIRPVVIEDHVWIGIRAIVLPGTHVGRGSVIAAGAVASGEIPPMSVVAGVPARVVAVRPQEALEYELADLAPLYE